jgi:peptide deformylase
LEIRTWDDPILKLKVCDTVTHQELKKLGREMAIVLKSTDTGVGLAAPQVGMRKKIILVKANHATAPLFMGNPRFSPIGSVRQRPAHTALRHLDLAGGSDDEGDYFTAGTLDDNQDSMESDWEGCLSFPDRYAYVSRARKIRCTYMNKRGKVVSEVFEGFIARVIQHEIDHLHGICLTGEACRRKLTISGDELKAIREHERASAAVSKDQKKLLAIGEDLVTAEILGKPLVSVLLEPQKHFLEGDTRGPREGQIETKL